jgi:hypothetical protein
MSLTTQFMKGQITVDEFAVKGAADVFKAFQFFVHLPFGPQVVDFIIGGIGAFIKAQSGSELLAANVVDMIRNEFAKLTGTPAA